MTGTAVEYFKAEKHADGVRIPRYQTNAIITAIIFK